MKIYNTLTRKKEEFKPIKKAKVGMYVCGPTVYDEPHLGHARAAYIFEVVRTYLEYKGFKVKFIQNITDIDDKIIAKAKEELPDEEINQAVGAIALKYTQRYYEDMDALRIRRACACPKATEYIPQMLKFIQQLIKKEFAYVSAGSVYFAVRKFKAYGRLSQQHPDQMHASGRIEPDEKKKSALDFALWKKAKPGEPSWPSPWGKGRPGWHIECSVMSSSYLGDEFDIHAGGQDLIFPHHENEIAQAQAYSGKGFARCWMHNGLLTINGQKMAKSLGNFIRLKDFLKENTASILKLFFLSAHYRSPVDFNAKRIQEAKNSLTRLQILYDKLKRIPALKGKLVKKSDKNLLRFKQRFSKAMEDDFNTPQALAQVFALASFCNKKLIKLQKKDASLMPEAKKMLEDYGRIFGLSFDRPTQKGLSAQEIEQLIKTRNQLREQKNFSQADQIRKELEEKGIILEDGPAGTAFRQI